jgi:hypothetical protein
VTPPPIRSGRPTGHRGADVSVAEAAAALRAAASDRPLLRRVLSLFRPYRRPASLIGVLILVTSGLGRQQYGSGLVEARTANGFRLSDGRVLSSSDE